MLLTPAGDYQVAASRSVIELTERGIASRQPRAPTGPQTAHLPFHFQENAGRVG